MPRLPRLSTTTPRARLVAGTLIGLAVGSALAAARHTVAVEGLELRLLDARTKTYMGSRRPDPDIVLAVVQNEDIAALRDGAGEQFPWSLETTSFAFQWLRAAGVKAVAVDVYQFDRGKGRDEKGLPQKAPEGDDEATRDLRARIEAAEYDEKEAEKLAAAYGGATGPVVLACELTSVAPEGGARAAELRAPHFAERLSCFPPVRARPGILRPHVNLPVLRLLRACASVGFANAIPDGDGIVRRVAPAGRAGDVAVPSLPLSAAWIARGAGPAEEGAVVIGEARQRLAADGTFYVALRGTADSYAQVRPADLVVAGAELVQRREQWANEGKDPKDVPLPTKGTAVPSAVAGKVVVWGHNPSGFKDVVSVPIDDNYPGPELQATILDNLLHGDGRVAVPPWLNAAITVGLAGLLGAVGGWFRRRGAFVLSFLGAEVAIWVGAYRAFAGGHVLDLFSPSLALLTTYAAVSAYQALTEGRRNKWLDGTFSSYLSPAVIEALKKDPELLGLGGRRRELTVLFSDVKGFTSISEALSPADLVKLMNDYLTRQSACVLEQEGVIDKFIGDAVMAFFGDPVPYEDHALRACRAAVACREALAGTTPLAQSLGLPPLLNRIGLASGPAVVGNMGSERRLSYTAMGDTVNFASRLEGANKAFGSGILIADGTYQRAKDGIVVKPLAKVVVVGKSEPIPVYELVGLTGRVAPELAAHVEAFTRAHAAVLADDLDAADAAIDEASRLRKGDGPCGWMRKLVAELRSGVRDRPWDGEYVLHEKG
ncbi:MAG: adenylate/guanylate cyclase domain-containing protein [Planctomycetes bacterium]|nr:adenylate/guanylate cyclase domain-containing protein [Planctomycetota bacterium]